MLEHKLPDPPANMDTGVRRSCYYTRFSRVRNSKDSADLLAGQGSNRSAMRKRMGSLGFSTGSGLVAILLWSTTIARPQPVRAAWPLTAAASVYLCGGALCLIRFFRTKAPLERLLNLPRNYLLGCGFLFVLYTVLLYLAVGLAADRGASDRDRVGQLPVARFDHPALRAATEEASQPVPLARNRFGVDGCILVMTQSGSVSWGSFVNHVKGNPAAYGLAFVAALSWALYSNLTRLWSGSGNDGAVELFVPVTGLVLLVMRLLSNEPTVWNARAVAEAGLLGGITALAYALWDLAMRKGDLVLVATGSYLTPLLSTLVGCAYLKVAPSP